MEPGGDDLQDDLVIDESVASGNDDESYHFIHDISQESEDDRPSSSFNAADSAPLLAKKRKRKAKDKERKAKVRSWRVSILHTECL